MKISKTSTYALRVLIYLANHDQQILPVRELHRVLHIPYKYLGRLMPRLAEAGMVNAWKGKKGGYRLRNPPDSVYLYRIIEIVDGWDQYEQCILGFQECSEEHPCPIHLHWAPIKNRMMEMFKTLTLQDLCRG